MVTSRWLVERALISRNCHSPPLKGAAGRTWPYARFHTMPMDIQRGRSSKQVWPPQQDDKYKGFLMNDHGRLVKREEPILELWAFVFNGEGVSEQYTTQVWLAAQQDDIGQQVASEGWAQRKSCSCPILGSHLIHVCKSSKVCLNTALQNWFKRNNLCQDGLQTHIPLFCSIQSHRCTAIDEQKT